MERSGSSHEDRSTTTTQPPRETVGERPRVHHHPQVQPSIGNKPRPKTPLNTLLTKQYIHAASSTHPSNKRTRSPTRKVQKQKKKQTPPSRVQCITTTIPHPDRSKPRRPTPHSLSDAADDACCGMVSKSKKAKPRPKEETARLLDQTAEPKTNNPPPISFSHPTDVSWLGGLSPQGPGIQPTPKIGSQPIMSRSTLKPQQQQQQPRPQTPPRPCA